MKRSKISPISPTLRKRKALYTRLNREFLAANPNCWKCGKSGTETHHKGGREGEWLTFVEWFVALCRDCHRFCEENKQEAIRLGFSVSNNQSYKDYIKSHVS